MRGVFWIMLCVSLHACQFSFSHEFRTNDPSDVVLQQPTEMPIPTRAPDTLTRTPWPTRIPVSTPALPDVAVITAVENHTMQLYQMSAPAVVSIEAAFTHPPIDGVDIPGDMFVAQGSGFLYDDQGHIVTNAHVVNAANTYRVRIDNQTVISATVIGRDRDNDLAVLRLAEYIDVAPLTLSQRVAQPGMWVLAIGNPFGLRDSVSVGIVSGIDRQLPNQYGVMNDIIQVDASVNPGSSGGVILDSSGAVLGLVTAIQSGDGNFAGIGYAIPTSTMSATVAALIAAYER